FFVLPSETILVLTHCLKKEEGEKTKMDSRRIVLFFPNTGFDIKGVSVDLPLAVLNLAAFIQNDFDVCIIDQRVEPDWRDRLTSELEKAPLCLGVSSMTCPQILYGLE